MRRLFIPAVGLMIALLAQILFANTSTANHRPWPDRVPAPDRGTHTFCFADPDFPMDTATRTRARRAMGNGDGLMAMTIITTDEQSTCPASIDIRFQQRAIGGGAGGDAVCVRFWDNGRCDRFRVRVDVALITQLATNVAYQVRKTICHEIGHTVGLWHYGDGDPYVVSADLNGANNCMRSGLWDSGAGWTRSYGLHDINAINSNW